MSKLEDNSVDCIITSPPYNLKGNILKSGSAAITVEYNTFKDMFFKSNFDKDFQIADNWKYSSLFNRSWAFNGSWFTGPVAELRMSCNLIRPSELNSNISYFHPRAFEQAVGDFLTNEYSILKVDGRSSIIAPHNWQPILELPMVAARLQVAPDELVTLLYTTKEYVFFPVADQCLVVMVFKPARKGRGSEAEMDKVISRSTMLALIDDIINSLKITLSPEAKTWQGKALEGLDDTSLIRNFPPMKWTTEKEDALWASKNPRKASFGNL